MHFSEDQILSMAPDDASKKSGKELANPSKWGKREESNRALWGECQGSGKLPYQTQIDLGNIAFKCSCPSRKFPCKHGLGLLLLYARDKKLFKTATEPDWVVGWLDKRNEREEQKSEKKEKEKKADPAAQAKRQETRTKRVEEGMGELRLWIKDIVRNGLVSLPGKDPAYFETMTRRMVDAQAPGLAAMVRTLRDINFFQEGWQTTFLDQLLRIYLVLEGFPRLETLSPALQVELRTQVGFTQSLDDVRAESGLREEWFVLAKRTAREDAINVERNWLYGRSSRRYALVLQFYPKGQFPEMNLMAGSWIDAEVSFFKGAYPLRALIKQYYNGPSNINIDGLKSWNAVEQVAAEILRENPLLEGVPVVIENVIPFKDGNRWMLRDEEGNGVFIPPTFQQGWQLLALSGGAPLKVFAMGKDQDFEPLGVWVNNRYTFFA